MTVAVFSRRMVGGILAASMLFVAAAVAGEASDFGKYQEGRQAEYSQYTRVSRYVPVADGTLLAVDIFRPATEGIMEEKPLPVIFYYGRYWRAVQHADGTIITNLGPWQPGQKIGSLRHRDSSGRLLFWDTGRESVVDLMRHGYVFVRAESRGTGASGGIRDAELSKTEARDGAALIQWIADQPWCDGNVGMIGGSYPGMAQLKVAAEAPPALKAIFPAVPPFDFYQLISGGSGLLHKGILSFSAGQAAQDNASDEGARSRVVAVDADPDRRMLDKILSHRREHAPASAVMAGMADIAPEFVGTIGMAAQALGHASPMQTLELLMSPPHLQRTLAGKPELQRRIARGLHLYRDTPAFSRARETGTVSPHAVLPALNAAQIPVYVWTGWYDQDTIGAFQLFHNLTGPKKITSGVWSHGPNEDNGRIDNPRDAFEAQARELLNAEALRWFDFWLKGIPNGIMDEPALHYAYDAGDGTLVWRTAGAWPLGDTRVAAYYLSTKTDTNGVPDDGALSPTGAESGAFGFTVDYTRTTGPQSRFHDSMSGVPAMAYPDMVAHAGGEGALTFTSAPLDEARLVVGHPEVTLHARSTAPDGDVFVYLEEVDDAGEATYLTEGVVRASHRTLGPLAYETSGLPFASSDRASVAQTPPFDREFAELNVTLQPTANLFEAGHRTRLVITGADMHNYLTPVFVPAPRITVRTGGDHASVLRLPLLDAD